jgi:hypothetical protein
MPAISAGPGVCHSGLLTMSFRNNFPARSFGFTPLISNLPNAHVSLNMSAEQKQRFSQLSSHQQLGKS